MQANELDLEQCLKSMKSSVLREEINNKHNSDMNNLTFKGKAVICMRKKSFARKVISEKHTKIIMNLITDATQRLSGENKEDIKSNDENNMDILCRSTSMSGSRMGEIKEQVSKHKSNIRMYTPLSRMIGRPSTSNNKCKSKIKLVAKRFKVKKSKMDNTLFQSYTKSNPENICNNQLRYCSFSKDSIQKCITSTSANELKYRSPAAYSMVHKRKDSKMNDTGDKEINDQLSSQHTFNTMQNKEITSMINREIHDGLSTNKVKDIDHFQDYCRQTDCEFGYDINSDNLKENANENTTNRSRNDIFTNQINENKEILIRSNNDTILRPDRRERIRPRTVLRQNKKNNKKV